MKLSIALIFAWVVTVSSIAYSKSESMPDIVDLGKYQFERNIPSRAGAEELKSVKFRFYPIGFSEKGLFAYFYFELGDPADCDVWEFVVLDLVNDKRAYDLSSRMYESPQCQEIKTVEDLARKHGTIIQTMLEKYQVNRLLLPKLGRFPLKNGDDLVSVDLAKKKAPEAYEIPYQVRLKSNKHGMKIVGVHMEHDNYVFGSKILGYLKSPYEPRIIILVQSFRSHHGPPYMAKLSLFGATLTSDSKNNK